jgi:hypothetical protein
MPVGAAERQESVALRPEPRGDRSWIGRRYTLLRPYATTTTPRPDRPSLPRDRVALRAAWRAANIAGPGQARHERHPVAVQVRESEKQLRQKLRRRGLPKPPGRFLLSSCVCALTDGTVNVTLEDASVWFGLR